ncbi:MAG: hypothetical protein IPK13_13100 [Deltaproteobacteria bacterium]|nr:hypothetical protein [Deltaproteobacteria bacterium]
MSALAARPGFNNRDEADPIDVTWTINKSTARAEFEVTTAFTERFRERLAGGLTSRVIIDAEIESATGRKAVEVHRECRLRLDIWDERVFVQIDEGGATWRRAFLVIDDALRACGHVTTPPLSEPLSASPSPATPRPENRPDTARYRIYVTVMLNPVSPELLEKTREFAWNPTGSPPGRGRAMISAVAKLFRTDAMTGGEVFHFRSQAFLWPREEVQ